MNINRIDNPQINMDFEDKWYFNKIVNLSKKDNFLTNFKLWFINHHKTNNEIVIEYNLGSPFQKIESIEEIEDEWKIEYIRSLFYYYYKFININIDLKIDQDIKGLFSLFDNETLDYISISYDEDKLYDLYNEIIFSLKREFVNIFNLLKGE